MGGESSERTVGEVSPLQVAGWLERGEVLLVDVREAREYEAEHIAGAMLLPLSGLDPDYFPVLPGRRVVLHCAIGKRSEAAARALAAAGREVAHMAGGLAAWKEAGLETELPLEEPRRPPLHPGQVLAREYLAPRGMDVASLAQQSGVSAARLAALLAGEGAVDSEISLRLARVFSTEPGFWMLLQVEWDLARAEAALAGEGGAPLAQAG